MPQFLIAPPDGAAPSTGDPPGTPLPTRRSGVRSRSKAISAQMTYADYLPMWAMAYAEWLVLDALNVPTRTERRVRLNELTRTRTNDAAIRRLESREDFQRYCDELRRGPLEQARAKFMRRLPEYIDAHYAALNMARDGKDHKALAQISEAALDRVLPKHDAAVVATQVIITLSPKQMAALSAPEETVLDGEPISDPVDVVDA